MRISGSGWLYSARFAATLAIAGAAATPGFAQRQAQHSWWDRAPEQHLGGFWIKSDVSDAQSRRIAARVNFMHDEYARHLGALPVRVEEKRNVLLFDDWQDYAMTLRMRFGVNVEQQSGLFFAGLAGPGLALCLDASSQRAFDHLLQREGFRLFAHSRFGKDLPSWASEGLAELFGRSVVIDDALLVGQATPGVAARLKQAVDQRKHVPFQAMLAMRDETWNEYLERDDAPPLHDQAWSMAHFLVLGDGGRHHRPFRDYLQHINNGLPASEAFERTFGGDVEGFESQWRRHVFSMQPGAFITALERIECLALGMLELRRRGIRPETMPALEAGLRDIAFECELELGGATARFKAADADAMTIPMDGLCHSQPQFIVESARHYNLTQRERELERADPTPAEIRTEHLRPRNLEIRWRRRADQGGFAYEVVQR